MLDPVFRSFAYFLLLLCLCPIKCSTFQLHGSAQGTYLPIMGAAVTATNTMAQIGANGTTSNGLTPNPLPSQYMANVELWLFDDDNLVTQIQQKLQGVVDNVNWDLDTSPESQDPIMITAGVDYLVQDTDQVGTIRWWDPWTVIFESTIDDEDIIACKTAGAYQGRTVMAVVRDLRAFGYSNRWVIHICKSAMIEQPYRSGVQEVTVNLLQANRNIVFFGPELRQYLGSNWLAELNIGSFRYIDFTLLHALLYIRQIEEGATSPDTVATVDYENPWEYCSTYQDGPIECQALYALARSLYYNGVPVDKEGFLGIYSL